MCRHITHTPTRLRSTSDSARTLSVVPHSVISIKSFFPIEASLSASSIRISLLPTKSLSSNTSVSHSGWLRTCRFMPASLARFLQVRIFSPVKAAWTSHSPSNMITSFLPARWFCRCLPMNLSGTKMIPFPGNLSQILRQLLLVTQTSHSALTSALVLM